MSELSLSSRLKKLLTDANISEAELARRTGIAQPMVNRLATGKNKNPKLETLKPIAKYFSVTFSQLLGEESLPADNNNSNNNNLNINHSLFQLPLVSWDNLDPNNLQEERTITTTAKASEKAFALLVQDHSLSPRFTANTVLVLDNQNEAKHNDFVVVKNLETNKSDLAQLKSEENNNTLVYLNNNNPEQVTFDLNKHKVLGVLIQAIYDYK